jgi:2,5-furandicarboxylate decarboxylase 1
MKKDLRSYLQQLIEHDRDQLMVVEREVDPEFEVAAIVDGMRANARYPKFPAVLFTNVKGSEVPLLINLHGTYERLALSIDSTVQSMVEEFARREANPIPVQRVERAEAPVKEVLWTGAEANLCRLPILRHQELDAGRYVTSAVSVTRDPASGVLNGGIFRAQLHGEQELGFQVGAYQSTRYIFLARQEHGEPLEVAMVIGHHPAWLLAGTTNPPGLGGELEVAGGLLRQPLEVVRAETLDLDVPARAEIVIEGIVDTNPDRYRNEGPFGEYPRYYTGSGKQPVFKVTAITTRRNPIYVDVFNAHDEHLAIGGLARMGFLLNRVRDVSPGVTGLHLPLSGSARNHAYVSMKKRADGEPHLVAFALMAYSQATKHVFIVDDDIDVTNESDVLWALATRFQADKDLVTIRNSIGSHLNPPTYAYKRDEKGTLETKLIFDCTRSLSGREFPPATRVPPSVKERFSSNDYAAPLTSRWESYLRGED